MPLRHPCLVALWQVLTGVGQHTDIAGLCSCVLKAGSGGGIGGAPPGGGVIRAYRRAGALPIAPRMSGPLALNMHVTAE